MILHVSSNILEGINKGVVYLEVKKLFLNRYLVLNRWIRMKQSVVFSK